MKGTKKKLIFKNKKKRKTNKYKLKKRKTYKKKFKKRKTFKRKLVGGVNINLTGNPDSRQNIKILAPFGENMQDITKPIEDLFKEDGFDEEDDDPDPPTFLQLENAFKKGLLMMFTYVDTRLSRLVFCRHFSKENYGHPLLGCRDSP